jgi:carboxypeptidase C (cathepsin A)
VVELVCLLQHHYFTPCSSLNGLLEQHGPFRPDANGNLQPNDATWTSIANM